MARLCLITWCDLSLTETWAERQEHLAAFYQPRDSGKVAWPKSQFIPLPQEENQSLLDRRIGKIKDVASLGVKLNCPPSRQPANMSWEQHQYFHS